MRPRLQCILSYRSKRVRAYGATSGGRFAPGAPGNYPSNILWLDANQGVGTDGSAVVFWTDPANGDNIATRSAAGAEPALVNGPNGLAAIRFDNRYLSLTFPLGATWADPGTIVFAIRMEPGAGYALPLAKTGATKPSISLSDKLYFQSSLDFFPANGYPHTDFSNQWAVFMMRFPIVAGSWEQNGNTSFSWGGPGTGLGGNFDRIGGGPDYNVADCDFYLGEIAFFSESLSGEAHDSVMQYFVDRWL